MAATLVHNVTSYLDGDTFGVINTLATKNVVAMTDVDTGETQSLYLAASKDVTIQASEGFNIQLGSNDALLVSDSAQVESFQIATDATTTTLMGVDKNLVLTTTDNANNSITVGSIEVSQSNNYQVIRTSMPEGFLIDGALKLGGYGIVEQSMAVGSNVVCNGSIYGQDYNLVKINPGASDPTDPKVVAYAFAVNDMNQLELMKHTSFVNGTKVSKKVTIFGRNRINNGDASDSAYQQFDDISNLATGSNPAMFLESSTISVEGNQNYNTITSSSPISVLTNGGSTRSITPPDIAMAKWAAHINVVGSDTEIPYLTGTDKYGNVYVSLEYAIAGEQTVVIYNADNTVSPVTMNNAAGRHYAIVKYNANGVAQWGSSIYSSSDTGCCSMAVDADGNTYLLASYNNSSTSTTTIYNSNGVTSNLSVRSTDFDFATCLVKFDASGVAQWVATIDASSYPEHPMSIAHVASGHIYVYIKHGEFSTAEQESLPIKVYGADDAVGMNIPAPSGVCIAKFDVAGNVQWCTAVMAWNASGTCMTANSSGVYITGMMMADPSSVQFYNADGTVSSSVVPTSTGSFIAKYSPDGEALWLVQNVYSSSYNGAGVDDAGNIYAFIRIPGDQLQSISTDGAGAGLFRNSDGTISDVTIPTITGSQSAGCVLKYDTNGFVVWCASVVGTLYDTAWGLCSDAVGNVYMTFWSTEILLQIYNSDGNIAYVNPRGESQDSGGFTVKFDTNGYAKWAIALEGHSFFEHVSVDPTGDILLSGGTAFYPGTVPNAVLAYDSDGTPSNILIPIQTNVSTVFVVKYSPLPSYNLVSNLSTTQNGFKKLVINTSTRPCTVNIRNATDTSTVALVSVPAKSKKSFVWYNSKWM